MQYRFDRNLESLTGTSKMRLIVAVSGGPDSMCLVNLLYNSSLECSIVIAHMNFNLRPGDCDDDERLVEKWAGERNIPFYRKSVDTYAYAAEHSLSVEMAARELRYSWFFELLEEGYDYVAIAHNANDNAETLLLNLTRGSGLKGLCGIKALDMERKIVRPLMIFERREIEMYIKKHSVPFAIDKTNLSTDFSRNRIRNRVIEELKLINPAVVATLNKDIVHLSSAFTLIESYRAEAFGKFFIEGEMFGNLIDATVTNRSAKRVISAAAAPYFECAVSVGKLMESPGWQYWLYAVASEYGFNGAVISSLSASVASRSYGTIFESAGYVAVMERGYLKIFSKGILVQDKSVELPLPCSNGIEVSFGGLAVRFRYECMERNGAETDSAPRRMAAFKEMAGRGIFSIDASRLSFPLEVRAMQKGDRFTPFGMRGSKSLSDYYTDIKMDNLLKNRLPVILSDGNVVALPGLQISDKYRVSEKSTRILTISPGF